MAGFPSERRRRCVRRWCSRRGARSLSRYTELTVFDLYSFAVHRVLIVSSYTQSHYRVDQFDDTLLEALRVGTVSFESSSD
ncbi:hypothetical protein [Natrialba sp. PRR66]|uniref:hypothetical protein n=1 Tax=Natrialba sp. PRR66 TaxID=3098146 RepID=UPI0034E0CCA8